MTGRRTPEMEAPCRPGTARSALGSALGTMPPPPLASRVWRKPLAITKSQRHSSVSCLCHERDNGRPFMRVASCYLDASVDRNLRRGSLFGAKVSDRGHPSDSHLHVQRSPDSRLGCSTVDHPLAGDIQRSSSRAMDFVTAHSMPRKSSHNGFLPWKTVVCHDGATNSGDYRRIVTFPMKGDSLAFNL